MNAKYEKFSNAVADQRARIVTTSLFLMSGLCGAQTQDSFTNKVNAAKSSASGEAAKTKVTTAVNTTVELVSLVIAAVGFLVFLYGIFWVMSASRSEGRKAAQPGWIMVIGGGILGTAVGVYYIVVSGASALGQ